MGRGAKSVGDLERHFRMRLLQRYGIALNQRLPDVNRSIRNNEAVFLHKESNSRTHFLVKIDGIDVHAVYDRSRGSVVTALPRDARQCGLASAGDGDI